VSAVWVVWLKEVRESLRDRRVLINAFLLGPFLGPILFVGMINYIVGRELKSAEKPLPVVVIGAAYAPNLVAALRQGGVEVKPAVADPEAAVREQTVDLALRIAPEFGADWRAGKLATVELIFDSSRTDGHAETARLRALLGNYSHSIGAMRLLARGVSPEVTIPVSIVDRDQATATSKGAALFAMLPYFIIFTAFLGGMFLAIDATAGERERQSLEPLLINPVPRWQILTGKLAASATFSFASVLLSVAAFMLAAWIMPTEKLEMNVNLGWQFCRVVLPVMVPLVILLSILQTLVAAYSKNFREAQTALGLLQLLPMIPSIALVIAPIKVVTWMYAVPLLGQQLTIMRMLRGELVTAQQQLLCMACTLLAAGLVWLVAKRVYGSERLAVAG
jgi:sodium transport system permease protein